MVDVLGYSIMSLSTLFAAFVFTGTGLERTARRFLIANGFLIPFLLSIKGTKYSLYNPLVLLTLNISNILYVKLQFYGIP
jgi:hypothetical protein